VDNGAWDLVAPTDVHLLTGFGPAVGFRNVSDVGPAAATVEGSEETFVEEDFFFVVIDELQVDVGVLGKVVSGPEEALPSGLSVRLGVRFGVNQHRDHEFSSSGVEVLRPLRDRFVKTSSLSRSTVGGALDKETSHLFIGQFHVLTLVRSGNVDSEFGQVFGRRLVGLNHGEEGSCGCGKEFHFWFG